MGPWWRRKSGEGSNPIRDLCRFRGLNRMITLGKDRYEHSYADGTDNGIKIGVDMTASGVITFMKEIGVTPMKPYPSSQFQMNTGPMLRKRSEENSRSDRKPSDRCEYSPVLTHSFLRIMQIILIRPVGITCGPLSLVLGRRGSCSRRTST